MFSVNGASFDKRLLYVCIIYAFDVNALGTTFDSVEQQFWLFTHHDKNCLVGWFLKKFQEFIGTFHIHSLWKPNNTHFISTLT